MRLYFPRYYVSWIHLRTSKSHNGVLIRAYYIYSTNCLKVIIPALRLGLNRQYKQWINKWKFINKSKIIDVYIQKVNIICRSHMNCGRRTMTNAIESTIIPAQGCVVTRFIDVERLLSGRQWNNNCVTSKDSQRNNIFPIKLWCKISNKNILLFAGRFLNMPVYSSIVWLMG